MNKLKTFSNGTTVSCKFGNQEGRGKSQKKAFNNLIYAVGMAVVNKTFEDNKEIAPSEVYKKLNDFGILENLADGTEIVMKPFNCRFGAIQAIKISGDDKIRPVASVVYKMGLYFITLKTRISAETIKGLRINANITLYEIN